MGARGPLRKTASDKIANGVREPSKVNYKEPEPLCSEARRRPAGLVGEGAEEWDRLIDFVCEYGYVSDGDTKAFEDYCRALTRLRDVEAIYRDISWDVRDEKIQMLGQVMKAQDQTSRLRVNCGLTPTSRASVRAAKGAKKSGEKSTAAAYLRVLGKGAA